MNYRIVGTSSDHLEHHGVENQKWGVQHGPPYPLDDNPVVQAARKAASKARASANMAKGRAKKAVKETLKTGENIRKSGKAVITSIKAGSKARKLNRQYESAKAAQDRERAASEEAERKASEAKAEEERKAAEAKAEEERIAAEKKAAEEKSKSEEIAYKDNVIKTGNIEEVFAHPEKFSNEEIGAALYRYQKITEIGNLLISSKPKEETPAPQQKKPDLELGRTKEVDDFIKGIVNEGNVNAAVKNASQMTKAELDATIAKRESIDKAANTTGARIGSTLNSFKNKSDYIEDSLKNVTGIIKNGVDLYNVMAKLYNQSDKKTGDDWKLIDLDKKKN